MKAKRRHRKQQASEYQVEKPFFGHKSHGKEGTFFSKSIQAKLKIGSAGDQYEKQADQVAGSVVRGETVQRREDMKVRKQEEEEAQTKLQMQEEEEEMQTKLQKQEEEEDMQAKLQKQEEEEEMQTKLQRQEEEEMQTKLQKQEEEEVQARSIQRKEAKAGAGLEARINVQKSGGSPLPEDVRKDLETRMTASFRHVRIHNDNAADKLCEELNALAFTVGNHIFFRSGQFQPTTSAGKELLAHELTHVLQQRKGI